MESLLQCQRLHVLKSYVHYQSKILVHITGKRPYRVLIPSGQCGTEDIDVSSGSIPFDETSSHGAWWTSTLAMMSLLCQVTTYACYNKLATP